MDISADGPDSSSLRRHLPQLRRLPLEYAITAATEAFPGGEGFDREPFPDPTQSGPAARWPPPKWKS